METLRPHRSAPREDTIHRPRHANGQPLQTARESCRAVRFDDEVQMVRLHREGDDANAIGGRASYRGPYGDEDASLT